MKTLHEQESNKETIITCYLVMVGTLA